MTFTLVSHLRERLTALAHAKEAEKKRLEDEKERRLLEVRVCSSFRCSSKDSMSGLSSGGRSSNARDARDTGIFQNMENQV